MAESQNAEFIHVQGDNLFQLLGPRYAPDSAAYMLLAALVMIPTVWLPDLKTLSSLGSGWGDRHSDSDSSHCLHSALRYGLDLSCPAVTYVPAAHIDCQEW